MYGHIYVCVCRTLTGNSDSFPEDGLNLALVTNVTNCIEIMFNDICDDSGYYP